jgi:cell division septation protein DedD
VQQLQAMAQHLSAEEMTRGEQLAEQLARGGRARVAGAEPAVTGAGTSRERPRPPRVAQADPRPQAPRQPEPPRTRPAPPAPAPAPVAQGGRWRIQLGAFSSEAGARSAWAAVSGRLPGLRPTITRAGAMFRLQAGGLASRDAAARACAAARTACFPVAP